LGPGRTADGARGGGLGRCRSGREASSLIRVFRLSCLSKIVWRVDHPPGIKNAGFRAGEKDPEPPGRQGRATGTSCGNELAVSVAISQLPGPSQYPHGWALCLFGRATGVFCGAGMFRRGRPPLVYQAVAAVVPALRARQTILLGHETESTGSFGKTGVFLEAYQALAGKPLVVAGDSSPR
jgi:hypothetical protein